jgi:hypothetical protein
LLAWRRLVDIRQGLRGILGLAQGTLKPRELEPGRPLARVELDRPLHRLQCRLAGTLGQLDVRQQVVGTRLLGHGRDHGGARLACPAELPLQECQLAGEREQAGDIATLLPRIGELALGVLQASTVEVGHDGPPRGYVEMLGLGGQG